MNQQKRGVFLVYTLNLSKEEPNRIHPGKPLFFSDIEKAETMIRQFRKQYEFLFEANNTEEQIYCLIMEEYQMDSPYRYQLSTRVYSPDGHFLSDCIVPDDGPFLGRAEHRIHHRIGDIVEVPCGEHLTFGIVLEQPPCFNEESLKYGFTASDDCYTILHYPSKNIEYAHAPLVFKPTRKVTDQVREELRSAYEMKRKNEL
jgi:hypothetical protein